MTEEKLATMQLVEDKLRADYFTLVKKGDTTGAMDLFHDKLQPLVYENIAAKEAMFREAQQTTKANASPLNKELFELAISLMGATEKPNTWHYGKVDVGVLINTLEANYTITRNTNAKDK